MPKKKYPKRSKHPDTFLVDTYKSAKLRHKITSPTSGNVTTARPEILTLPNPAKGFYPWFGVALTTQQELLKIVKKWLGK